jgi:hypothetical protein
VARCPIGHQAAVGDELRFVHPFRFHFQAFTGGPRSIRHLTAPDRPGVRKIAARFGVNPGTVQRISRPFEASAFEASAVAA